MCGIVGGINLAGKAIPAYLISKMAFALRHRGPDDEGYLLGNTATGHYRLVGGQDTPQDVFFSGYLYSPRGVIADISENGGYNLALANRRLAIIDLSAAGHQPMCNEDGTIWIVHNGEIYNFRKLRRELQSLGHRFVSDVDTEVIIHAYEEWGVGCLNKFNGMWAFCIWDLKKQKLFCSRDRFGIKPLYYYFDGEQFLFASEIKALLQASIPKRANERRIYDYLVLGMVDHTEETFFEKIKQLRGGEYLELSIKTGGLSITRYWDIDIDKKFSGFTDEEYARIFYELLKDAVRLHLISDVPLGTCLSGGLDSSAIVCLVDKLMCEEGMKIPGSEKQKTFSARYEDPRHDEGHFIEHVVRETQVNAHFIYPTGEGLLEEIEELIYRQDEPFGSTSIYAQWSVFKLAKMSGVKVTLDGQGGDELFAGYHSYFSSFFAELLRAGQWSQLFKELQSYATIHGYSKIQGLGRAVLWLLPEKAELVFRSLRRFAREGTWLRQDFLRRSASNHPRMVAKGKSIFDNYLYTTLIRFSLPSLLRFEDRNSMAHSIESRVPFLDYRLVEFVFATPATQKIHNGVTKRILRDALRGMLPEPIRTRTDKIGFSTPEDTWLRTTMRGFLMGLVASESFRSRPYFDVKQVKKLFEAHIEGRRNVSNTIWRIINLELWLRRFID